MPGGHDEEAAAFHAASANMAAAAEAGVPTVFDKIVKKEVPASLVYEDDKVRNDYDYDQKKHSQILRPSSRHLQTSSSLGLRAAPSGCMSGTLGDVFLFRANNGGFPGVVVEEASGGMSLDEKDGRLSNKQRKDNSNALGSTASIEWQQLIKDGVNANAGNRSMFGDSDSGSFPVLSQQKFHFMGSIGVGSGSPWDCPRADGTAVNYLQAFGPVASGSNNGVDGQLGEIRLAVDGQQQMLSEVLRRPSSSCEVAADGPGGVKEEEEFTCGADSSSTISSHILQGGTISNSGQQQSLFAPPRGLMTSSASMQQLNRSPNHAIRNLFPEKSSSFSSAMLQTHEDLGGNKVVDEQGLLQLPKKPRMQEYGDGGPVSSPLPLSEVENANRLNHRGSSGQYRKNPFAADHRNALASLIDGSSYSKSSPTSFSASYPPPDRSTAFNSSSLSSLQNPSISLSDFQTSGCSLLPMKNSSNENISMKSPSVDYVRYTLDSNNRMQGGGDYRGELLGSGRDSFLGGSSPQTGLNFMPLAASLTSQPFSFSCRRQSSLDTVGRAAWPAGLLGNVPSLSIETPSRTLLPSKRTMHDREQPEGLLEDREARRVHSAPDSRRRLLIQKQLTTTDVGSLGRIILPKKEAENHLPHLPDKEGMEMFMYDYEADRTWTMKYRFWPNNKSRMYLLENTGEFAKFHALQQGDWLFIYRESVNRYVLRAKKSAPLLQVTQSSQSVTEPTLPAAGGPPATTVAEDVGGPASASGRTANQSPSPASTTDGGSGTSSSKEMVCGTTTAASSNQHSLDVPSSRFSASPGGAGGATGPAPPIVVEAKKPVPPPPHHHQPQHDQLSSGTLNSNNNNSKHLVHQLQSAVRAPAASRGASVEDEQHHHEQQHHHHHPELRLKNYMAVQHQQQQQQPDHEMPSELDGGGDFNLEDFPRLIDADDETIENILGNSESHVSVDGRSRSALSLRGGRGEEEEGSSSRRSI